MYSHFGPVERVVTETKTGGGAVSVGDIATAVLPSLVTISTQPVTAAGLATGSATGLTEGFAVSSDGLIVTSAHAVRGATRLRVATADGKGYDATIAASDIADGIVVLRAAGASGLTPLHFAAQDPRIGDLAVAVFRPALGTLTTRSGVVAAVGVNAERRGRAARRPSRRRRHGRAAGRRRAARRRHGRGHRRGHHRPVGHRRHRRLGA